MQKNEENIIISKKWGSVSSESAENIKKTPEMNELDSDEKMPKI